MYLQPCAAGTPASPSEPQTAWPSVHSEFRTLLPDNWCLPLCNQTVTVTGGCEPPLLSHTPYVKVIRALEITELVSQGTPVYSATPSVPHFNNKASSKQTFTLQSSQSLSHVEEHRGNSVETGWIIKLGCFQDKLLDGACSSEMVLSFGEESSTINIILWTKHVISIWETQRNWGRLLNNLPQIQRRQNWCDYRGSILPPSRVYVPREL